MNSFINLLETSFAPKMQKINQNIWVTVLKDSIMQTMPFILLGSFLCMLTIPGDVFGWGWWPNFWTPFGWTMGMVSLFVAFLVPFNMMERKRKRKQRIIAGLAGIVLFLIVITPQLVLDEYIGVNHSAMGAGGMFIAIFTGIVTALIMSGLSSISFFKDDSALPDFIRAWFDSLIPIAAVIIPGWLVVDVLGIDLYTFVTKLFAPLGTIVQTPYGFVITMFVFVFLYSMGISSWVLTPVVTPPLLAATMENIAMLQAGTATNATLNLVTSETIYSTYLWIGGIGCTIPLLLMLLRSRSTRLKALGKACVGPSIFNINEPIVFGCIAWNPILMIPFWLQALVLPTVTYIFTKVIPLAPIPATQFMLWYCPFPIAPWLTTGSIMAVVLMLVNFIISYCIWYPFFKAYEKQEVDAEQNQQTASN